MRSGQMWQVSTPCVPWLHGRAPSGRAAACVCRTRSGRQRSRPQATGAQHPAQHAVTPTSVRQQRALWHGIASFLLGRMRRVPPHACGCWRGRAACYGAGRWRPQARSAACASPRWRRMQAAYLAARCCATAVRRSSVRQWPAKSRSICTRAVPSRDALSIVSALLTARSAPALSLHAYTAPRANACLLARDSVLHGHSGRGR